MDQWYKKNPKIWYKSLFSYFQYCFTVILCEQNYNLGIVEYSLCFFVYFEFFSSLYPEDLFFASRNSIY